MDLQPEKTRSSPPPVPYTATSESPLLPQTDEPPLNSVPHNNKKRRTSTIGSTCMACRDGKVKCSARVDTILPCKRCKKNNKTCQPQQRGPGRPIRSNIGGGINVNPFFVNSYTPMHQSWQQSLQQPALINDHLFCQDIGLSPAEAQFSSDGGGGPPSPAPQSKEAQGIMVNAASASEFGVLSQQQIQQALHAFQTQQYQQLQMMQSQEMQRLRQQQQFQLQNSALLANVQLSKGSSDSNNIVSLDNSISGSLLQLSNAASLGEGEGEGEAEGENAGESKEGPESIYKERDRDIFVHSILHED